MATYKQFQTDEQIIMTIKRPRSFLTYFIFTRAILAMVLSPFIALSLLWDNFWHQSFSVIHLVAPLFIHQPVSIIFINIVLILLAMLFALYYLGKQSITNFECTLTTRNLIIKKGIMTTEQLTVPRKQIQSAQLVQSASCRARSLTNILVTALCKPVSLGMRPYQQRFRIKGISEQDATKLLGYLTPP